MAKIISLKKSEKLAILKIMIETNNIYSSRLPNGFKYIQETATFLNIPDGIADACDMSITDAKELLAKVATEFRDNFFLNRLGFMIMTSDYGVCKNVKQQFKDSLVEPFVHEWNYVFELLNISERWIKFHVAKNYLMRHTRKKNNPSEEWIIYDSKEVNVVTKSVKPVFIAESQASEKTVPPIVDKKAQPKNHITPYSEAIKELLYKDL